MSPAEISIRIAGPDDWPLIRQLFVELQDHEVEISPGAPAGELIADAYLAWMAARCQTEAGSIGVAERDGDVVGFATILCHVERTDPDDPVPVHAYLSELAVSAAARGTGVGTALIRWAEEQARSAGRDELRIGAVAANDGARRLYERLEFRPLHIIYGKQL